MFHFLKNNKDRNIWYYLGIITNMLEQMVVHRTLVLFGGNQGILKMFDLDFTFKHIFTFFQMVMKNN